MKTPNHSLEPTPVGRLRSASWALSWLGGGSAFVVRPMNSCGDKMNESLFDLQRPLEKLHHHHHRTRRSVSGRVDGPWSGRWIRRSAPYFSFEYGDGGGIPADVNSPVSKLPRTVKLLRYSATLADWMCEFRQRIRPLLERGFQGPINPGDNLPLTSISMSLLPAVPYSGVFTPIYGQTKVLKMPESSRTQCYCRSLGKSVASNWESSSFTQPGDTGIFQGYLYIDWTGFSPTIRFQLASRKLKSHTCLNQVQYNSRSWLS